jgi:hypothetical protein
MKLVALYLVIFLSTMTYLSWLFTVGELVGPIKMIMMCAVIGGIGGGVYCLRAIYITVCVKKNWDDQWLVWYYLVCYGARYTFMRFG